MGRPGLPGVARFNTSGARYGRHVFQVPVAEEESLMAFHILMPFSREATKDFWLREIGKLNNAGQGNFLPPAVIWHPIVEESHTWPDLPWLQPFAYQRDAGTKCVCLNAINKFLSGAALVDDDYYCFLADDDFFEPGFFTKLAGINTSLIMVSAARGQQQPPGSEYPCHPLIASIFKMKMGLCTGSQLIIKGRALRPLRFVESHDSDGILIEQLWNSCPHEQFCFMPDVWTWFNYLEPGRWNDAPKVLTDYRILSRE